MSDLYAALREHGVLRDCAAFASCAGEPCDSDATAEFQHTPDGLIWVPVCDYHLEAATSTGLEYVVEVHGFVPPVQKSGR